MGSLSTGRGVGVHSQIQTRIRLLRVHEVSSLGGRFLSFLLSFPPPPPLDRCDHEKGPLSVVTTEVLERVFETRERTRRIKREGLSVQVEWTLRFIGFGVEGTFFLSFGTENERRETIVNGAEGFWESNPRPCVREALVRTVKRDISKGRGDGNSRMF